MTGSRAQIPHPHHKPFLGPIDLPEAGVGFSAAGRAILSDGLLAIGVPAREETISLFAIHAALLERWRDRAGLTSVRAEDDVIRRHFIDSLGVLSAYRIPPASAVIDVGSGGGFPGMPLKVVRPDLRLTLLEPSRRRAAFLELLVSALRLDSDIVSERAEVLGRRIDRREAYDLALSRAVGPTSALIELCLPLVRPGGAVVLLKGPGLSAELPDAGRRASLLGGQIVSASEVPLSRLIRRTRIALIIRKVRHTASTYPRRRLSLRESPP